MPNGKKMTGVEHSDNDSIIYNTPQESLRTGRTLNTSTGIQLRPIQDLIKESEASQTTESTDTYTDPVDDAMDDDTDTPPPSTPPSTPPPSHHHHHQVVVEVDMEEDTNVTAGQTSESE